jgi:hypothetical protein
VGEDKGADAEGADGAATSAGAGAGAGAGRWVAEGALGGAWGLPDGVTVAGCWAWAAAEAALGGTAPKGANGLGICAQTDAPLWRDNNVASKVRRRTNADLA